MVEFKNKPKNEIENRLQFYFNASPYQFSFNSVLKPFLSNVILFLPNGSTNRSFRLSVR